jgi:hypothetical protein
MGAPRTRLSGRTQAVAGETTGRRASGGQSSAHPPSHGVTPTHTHVPTCAILHRMNAVRQGGKRCTATVTNLHTWLCSSRAKGDSSGAPTTTEGGSVSKLQHVGRKPAQWMATSAPPPADRTFTSRRSTADATSNCTGWAAVSSATAGTTVPRPRTAACTNTRWQSWVRHSHRDENAVVTPSRARRLTGGRPGCTDTASGPVLA